MNEGHSAKLEENSNPVRNAYYAMRTESENTQCINGLTNNKDSSIPLNKVKENDIDLQDLPMFKIGICKHCGKPFEKRTTWHVFCEEQCRVDYHGVDLEQLRKRKGGKK